jgi:hypothetical protein
VTGLDRPDRRRSSGSRRSLDATADKRALVGDQGHVGIGLLASSSNSHTVASADEVQRRLRNSNEQGLSAVVANR